MTSKLCQVNCLLSDGNFTIKKKLKETGKISFKNTFYLTQYIKNNLNI